MKLKYNFSLAFLLIFMVISVKSYSQKNISDNNYEMIFSEYNVVGTSEFGTNVQIIGDFNGDSFDDFMVSAPKMAHNTGRCYMYFGGTNYDTIPDLILDSPEPYAEFGSDIANIGDVNNDGFDDILIGAPSYDINNGVLVTEQNFGSAFIYFGNSQPDTNVDYSIYGDYSADNFGSCVAGIGDVNNDGISDFAIGAYGESNNRGKAFVYLGGINFNIEEDLAISGPASNGYFGFNISSAGDFNNDTYDDFIVGAPNESKAYLYYGGNPFIDGIKDLTFTGTPSTKFGQVVMGCKDLNNDNRSDLVISAPATNSSTGEVYVFYGNLTPDMSADLTFTGVTSGTLFGSQIDTCDLNNDNETDLIISAPGTSSISGFAKVYLGGSSFDNVSDLDIIGENTDNYFGGSISSDGDINNDGIADLIVGAKSEALRKGKVYIYHGNVTINSVEEYKFFGENTDNFFGYSIDNIGDFNGDGFDDFISGAYGYKNQTGKVYIYFGGENANTLADWSFTNTAQNEYYGYSVAGIGDINSDGYSDVLVGAYGKNSNEGAAYVFLGSSTPNNLPDLTLVPESAAEGFGKSISGCGDYNADGYDDFMIGAENYLLSGKYGRVYIYFGSETSQLNSTADFIINGTESNFRLGSAVSKVGDYNGDTFDDILIGLKSTTTNGKAYLYFGGPNYASLNKDYFAGFGTNDGYGTICSEIGDINNDGYADIAISAPDRNFVGEVYIYFGNTSNGIDITVTGSVSHNQFGKFINSFGDINDDEIDDFGIFSPDLNGKIFIWYGKSNISSTYDLLLEGIKSGGNFGTSFCSSGNFYGHFSTDILVGAQYASSNGEVYLFKGLLVPPVITSQSSSTTICQGSDVEFIVSAIAEGPISYQWFVSSDNGVSFQQIDNEISTNLTLNNVQTSFDGNIYKCIISSEGGTIESENIELTVDQFIQANAGNDEQICGTSYTLTANNPTLGTGLWITESGYAVFSDSYSNASEITDIQFGINTFRWNITNGTCQSSDIVTITSFEFVEAIAGTDDSECDLTEYQLNGNNHTVGLGIWTSDLPSLNFSNPNLYNSTVTNFQNNEVTFTWTITNGECTDFDSFTIDFNNSPQITSQPQSTSKQVGQSATFSIVATGDITDYQWKKNGNIISDGGSISGSNTTTLTIQNCTQADAGNYTVFITGECNNITSSVAILTVTSENSITEISDFISIYPNPCNEQFTIDFGYIENLNDISVKIKDLTGKTINTYIISENKIIIDLSNYNKGVYIVEIEINNQKFYKKIFKQ